jgi:hypothetical protein
MYRYFFGILIFGFLGIYSISLGQSFGIETNVSIDASPEDPEPGQEVVVTLSSYEADLDISYIKWSYEGNTKSGTGEKEFKITAPNESGRKMSISANITLADGEELTKTINLVVNSYDIAWEAVNTKSVPFYLGKRIPIRENNIRVAVINPNINPKTTSYTWSKNGKIMQSGKGIKNYLDFKNSELDKKEDISVKITSNGDTASRNISIPFNPLKVVFYEYHPIFGLNLGNSIKDKVLNYEDTSSVLAVPLGIGKNSKAAIDWSLSNKEVLNQQNPYLLSFGTPKESGVVPISISIENLNSLYQTFKGSLKLKY